MNELLINGNPLNSSVPAHLRRQRAVDTHLSIKSGLPAGSWQKISYAGSKWALVSAEGAKSYTNTMDLDFIFVRANPNISKRYYEGAYDPNRESQAPDCWADNGAGPGPRVASPQSVACANCKLNMWGSDVGISGKATKACSDVKRLSVMVFAPNKAGGDPALLPGTWEFDVPGASLKNLNSYVKMMESNNAAVTMLVTRVSFVAESNFPQFQFAALRWLSEAEMLAAEAAYDAETTQLQIGTLESGAPVAKAAIAAPQADPVLPPAPKQAPTPPADDTPPGVDPAAWAVFKAQQAGPAHSPPPTVPTVPTVQVEPEKRGRGRPPTKAVPAPQVQAVQQAAATASGSLFGSAGVAPAATPQPSQQVVLDPPKTSAAVDALLAGIPGLS